MKLNELTCPRCGAPLRGKPTDGKLECQYCGTVFLFDSDDAAALHVMRREDEPEPAHAPSDPPPPQRPPVKPRPVGLIREPEEEPPAEPKKKSLQPWMICLAAILLIAGLLVFPVGKPKTASQPSPTAAPAEAPETTSTPVPTATPVPKTSDSFPDFGLGDTRYKRPNYKGMTGYAAVSRFGFGFHDYMNEFDETEWVITTYERDKQFWNKAGSLPHKTRVKVLEQITENSSYSQLGVKGYLLVETTDSQERFYIDVCNFCTDPYWLYDICEAVATSYVVAEYHQVSDYYPVERNRSKVELEDGTLVLCIGRTGIYGSIGPDNKTNQIETHVIGPICYNAFFNAADLTVIY